MQYTVYFVIRDWIETTVEAETQEKAIEKAKKRVASAYSNNIRCVDGKTEFAGILLDDVTNTVTKD